MLSIENHKCNTPKYVNNFLLQPTPHQFSLHNLFTYTPRFFLLKPYLKSCTHDLFHGFSTKFLIVTPKLVFLLAHHFTQHWPINLPNGHLHNSVSFQVFAAFPLFGYCLLRVYYAIFVHCAKHLSCITLFNPDNRLLIQFCNLAKICNLSNVKS